MTEAAEVARQIGILLKGLALRAEKAGLTALSEQLRELAAEADRNVSNRS